MLQLRISGLAVVNSQLNQRGWTSLDQAEERNSGDVEPIPPTSRRTKQENTRKGQLGVRARRRGHRHSAHCWLREDRWGQAVRGRLGWSIVAVVVVIAAAVSVQQLTPRVQSTSSTSATVTAVFYSGEGCAGLAEAGAAARRLREQWFSCVPGEGFASGAGFYNGRWASDTHCDPSQATYPATIGGHTVTQLVGYSLGRLGPLYLLRASTSLAAKVTSIIMIDPGSSEISSNDCDIQHNSAGLLQQWLAHNPNNRLTIMAGRDTQAENYAGINDVYLSSLSASARRGQVLICAANLSHDDMMSAYGPMLIGRPSPGQCPSGSQSKDTPSSPGGSGGPVGSGGGASLTGSPTAAPPANGSISIGWSSVHSSWITMSLNGFPSATYRYTCNFGSGGPATFTITSTSSTQTIDNGQTCQDATPGDTLWVTIGSARSNTLTVPAGARGGGAGSSSPSSSASIQIGWSATHPTWIVMTLAGFGSGSYQYTCNFGSGGAQSYTVGVSTSPETWDNGHTCFDSVAGDRVWVTIGSISSNSLTVPGAAPPPPSPGTHAETVGGPTATWTNYTNAGGSQGQTIATGQTVQISCVVTGFRVADGDTSWYRIAQSPWNNAYYASADAFYNNGSMSGSLHGTPFVDPAVPSC